MTQLSSVQIAAALDSIDSTIASANKYFSEEGNPWNEESAAWNLKKAYTSLLALTEVLGMPVLRQEIAQTYSEAQAGSLTASQLDPNDEPYLLWAGPAYLYTDAIRNIFSTEPARTITKDLESILRSATYAITDPVVFPSPPRDEKTLHQRLEAVLKCLFPDLVTKPRLGKPVRNFEPDTGIPSLRTLLEYKYQTARSASGRIVQEILADTRGYHSSEWSSIIFVIYETARFQSEAQWRQLLVAAAIPDNVSVVVMSGVDSPSVRAAKRP